MWFYILFSALGLVWVDVCFADPQVRKYVMCRNGKIVRTIRVETNPKDKNSWITMYTKNGVDEIVGEAKNPSSCDVVLERVQKTLETNSWKCRDMQNATIHRETAGI